MEGLGLMVGLRSPTNPPAGVYVNIIEWTVLAGGKAWDLDVLALGSGQPLLLTLSHFLILISPISSYFILFYSVWCAL